MKRFYLFGLTLLLVMCFSITAIAEDKTVTVEGLSGFSKDDALKQAMRSAVEQAIGVFVHSRTEVEDFEVKKDRILSKTQGYVTKYDIIEEKKESDGVFFVKIIATVSLDKIKDDLIAMKILLDTMERPKIMILIKEAYASMDHVGMRIAETELNSLMMAKGFELVDSAQVDVIREKDQAKQALMGNLDAAKRLGAGFGAQYVIMGKAVTQDAGEAFPGTGIKSIQSSLQLKVVQTQTGLLLGSTVKNGIAAHISPLTGATMALKKASKLAVDEYLVNAITNSFQDYLNNGTPLKLHVTGVKSFRQYKDVAGAVESLDRMASSKKEGWNKASGLLVLDLRFKGTGEELAEMLDGLNAGGKTFEVTDFEPERVDCKFK